MRRNLFTAGLFIWVVTGTLIGGFAQADLPVVNVFAPVNSIAEGTNAYSGDTGDFVLTSNQMNGISLNLEFSGTATIADFNPFVSTDGFSRLSSFPTNVSIPPGTNSVTFSFRAARDGFV